MKTLLIIFIALFSISCSEPIQEKKKRTDLANIERFVTDFASQNKNWSQNEIINARTDKSFEESIIQYYKNPKPFANLTFKLNATGQTSGNKYVAKFENIQERLTDTRNINIEVAGIINEEMANQLKTDSTYQIEGNFVKFIKSDVGKISPDGSNNVSIGFSPLIDSTYFLGLALFKITKVTPYKKRRY